MIGRALIIFMALASPVRALDLAVPNAAMVRTETDPAASVRLPEGPWSPGMTPPMAEGAIRRQVFRTPTASRTTLQLLDGLRETLSQEGYEEVFSCADAACGGFDFRFQLDILGEPDMHVDLGDYRYVLMRAADPEAAPHTVALLASRSRAAGFVHITYVSEPEQATTDPAPAPDVTPVAEPESDELTEALSRVGHVVLPDLDFETGTSDLGLGPFASLQKLADWLAANPSARILLVGHTDSVGSLDANTALSEKRAQSVARHLVSQLGADPSQVQAVGAGYLSPVAPNVTEEGRARNRRVEAVLLSLD